MELKIYKRHEKGGATYLIDGTRARVIVSRKAFDGTAPDTIEFNAANIRQPNEKEKAKADRMAQRLAKESPEVLADRIEKTRKKLARLEAAASQQLPSASNEQPFNQANA